MKKHFFYILFAAVLLVSCGETPSPQPQGKTAMEMAKSKKRGVAFNFNNLSDLPLLSPYISWDYNWGNTTSDNSALWFDANEMDFCPMCWNGNYSPDRIRAFVAAHPNTKYLLAFNEPNLTDQANMTPSQAAELWQPVVALAKELNLKLVSPAMNYGTLSGYSDPIKWLDEFFAQPQVSADDVYAISVHCYMASTSAVQGYIDRFVKYGKPIWLTEFCAWDPVPGNVGVQMSYMSTVLNYLEQNPSVERYAWFIPRSSAKVDSAPYMQLLTHTNPPELTELGKIYCYFSSFDNESWLSAGRFIHAGEYVSLSDNSIPLRVTTDADAVRLAGKDGLMITNLLEGHTLTYHINASAAKSSITLRYCGFSNSICEVIVDGVSQNFADMQRNGSSTEWTEVQVPVTLSPGNHIVKFSMLSGSCYFSGFSMK